MGVSGLAWGVVLGAFMHVLIQYLDLRSCGFQYAFSLKGIWSDAYVRKIVSLMIPRSVGMAVNQINFLIITVFASMLTSGSLAVFTLANNIQSVPLGLFGIAFSLAVFPNLSALASKKMDEEFFNLFAKTFRRIMFFVFPLGIFIIILRAQIVRVILGSGQFDWNDTIQTFNVLGVLSISLFAQSLIPLLARAFFALHDTKTPLYIALVSEVFHIGFMYFLVSPFHIIGLALAFSMATILNMVFLYIALRRKFSVWNDRDIFSPSIKIVIISLIAGAVAQFIKTAFGFSGNEIDTFVAVLIQLFVTSFVGVFVFIVLGWQLKIEEFEHIKNFFMRHIFGQPQNLVEAEEQIDKSSSHT
jgi:putative peptidoglycan lipid II flippase